MIPTPIWNSGRSFLLWIAGSAAVGVCAFLLVSRGLTASRYTPPPTFSAADAVVFPARDQP